MKITNPSVDEYYNLTIDDTHGSPDKFIFTTPVNVYGNLLLEGGTLDLSGSSAVNVTGNVSIGAGTTLIAPSAATSTAFTVGGNWTNNGTFNNSNGEVNFDTTTTATFIGNTIFHNFYTTAAGKTIYITAGSNQTVQGTFYASGTYANAITFESTVSGTPWSISLSSNQSVNNLNVFDSNALNDTITCLNCDTAVPTLPSININARDNNNWIFENLLIQAPAIGTTIGQTPTLIGIAPPGFTIYFRDSNNNLVATTKADINGKFRVVVGHDEAKTNQTISPTQLALTPNPQTSPPTYDSITPYLTLALINPGNVLSNLTVIASPTPANPCHFSS